MDGMDDASAAWAGLLSNEEAESVPGLAEWIEMARWRANWRSMPDPQCSSEELGVLFRRVMRRGYAAYLAGERAMPELFARDTGFASMWQAGYADARVDAELSGHPCP